MFCHVGIIADDGREISHQDFTLSLPADSYCFNFFHFLTRFRQVQAGTALSPTQQVTVSLFHVVHGAFGEPSPIRHAPCATAAPDRAFS